MSTNYDRLNESNPQLTAIIRDEIEHGGPIRFDRFMELALYHPEHGYYRSTDPAPGRSGDFLTAPEAHPIFGATLAAQVVDFDARLGHPDRFSIIEYGAGSGRLIRPLLAELRQHHPDFYHRVLYTPFELNQTRLGELQEHLEQGGHIDRLAREPLAGGATGCALANEFLDAFPARRITRIDGELREAFVDWREGWFDETSSPVRDQSALSYLERHRFDLSDGEWVEFHEGVGSWISELDNALARGYALIIDYGYPAPELLAGHRRKGTLKAYYRHGASNQFYRGVGRQDLTAHVNFSELAWLAEQRGMIQSGITTQADLLAALGIGERLVRLQESSHLGADDYLGVRAAVLRMIDPGAMGRFRAVILSKSVDVSGKPRGLRAIAD